MADIIKLLAAELKQPEEYVKNVVQLLDDGCTLPFIARYRKELHGAMSDEILRDLFDKLNYFRNLEERKEEVIRLIDEQGKLTEELAKQICDAKTLAKVEDLYRPYKQKKRTRATIAKEKGLEPLALLLFAQGANLKTPEEEAVPYVDPEKGVESVEDALKGAADIVAEAVSDSPSIRDLLRSSIRRGGSIISRAAKEEDSVYRNYYEFDAAVSKVAGYQILALNRGEKEGFLKISFEYEPEEMMRLAKMRVISRESKAKAFLEAATDDGVKRLLLPSIENEIRSDLTDNASEGAIGNFRSNLRELLLQPPVKGKVTMGLDPGYRMGCKVAVIDATGKVLDTTVVYPTFSEAKKNEAIFLLKKLIDRHHVEHIAIGNGTASRETEAMAVELIHHCPGVSYMIVSEAGASVYSASKLASEEFPDYDVNLRSAVSIARRLEDPLAELVKIEPKAIGVGQYQHDMNQKRLEEALGGVVDDCVNAVGVDLNTASHVLLSHISGLTKTTAENIVKYREENGPYKTRRALLKVPKLGEKAFTQCAGFLRIPGAKNVLDNTSVHPESYEAAEKLMTLCGFSKEDLSKNRSVDCGSFLKLYGEEKAAKECGVGVLTLRDIVEELKKPGRDLRDSLPAPVFRTDVLSMEDLKPGMVMTGTVRNVIDFGAFVDIGVHQDGLVHISEICDRFIKHPSEALKIGDNVKVVILGVDLPKKRISLSIKKAK